MIGLESLWPDPASAPFSLPKPIQNDRFGASVAHANYNLTLNLTICFIFRIGIEINALGDFPYISTIVN